MNIIDPCADQALDWTYKGLAAEMEGLRISQIGDLGYSLFDGRLMFPVAVLLDNTLRSNSAWMRQFLELTGADIAPHGKTTMAPALFKQQIEDGAWAISAATMHHVRAYRRFGVSRIFLANQLIGNGAADWLVAELRSDPAFEFFCLVDSRAGIAELAAAVQRGGLQRPINVLLEVGADGGRAGIRSTNEGLELARFIEQHPEQLMLAGVETFEGIFQMADDGQARAQEMIDEVLRLAQRCDAEGLFRQEIILSAGGSAYFDLACRRFELAQLSRPSRIVIRSGCYLSHDNGMYQVLIQQLLKRRPEMAEISPPLQPALQVWTQVQSRPEPGRLICAMGKRDVGTDAHPPRLISWKPASEASPRPAPSGHETSGLNDQHTFIDCPADSPLQTGDFVGFGVSHPCTTFDRWRLLFRVDEQFRITGAIRTYF